MEKGNNINVNGIEGIIDKVLPDNKARVILCKAVQLNGYQTNVVIVKPIITYKVVGYI